MIYRPDIKPPMWGPPEAVQWAVRHNAERLGIDPASIKLLLPFWEVAGLPIDLATSLATQEFGTGFFTEKGYYFDGATGTYIETAYNGRITEYTAVVLPRQIEAYQGFAASGFTSDYYDNFAYRFDSDLTTLRFYSDLFNFSGEVSNVVAANCDKDAQFVYQFSETGLFQRVYNGHDLVISNNSLAGSVRTGRTSGTLIGRHATTYKAGIIASFVAFNTIISTSQITQLHETPYALLMPVARPFIFDMAGGSGISLAPNSLTQLNSISAPSLVQSHILNGDALNQRNTLSGLELTIAQELAIANLISSNSLSSVGLAQKSNLSVDSLVNAQSINEVDLVQFHLLGVDGLLNSQTLEGIDLKQANILGVDDLTISADLESLVLAQKNLLTLDSLVCANSLGSLELNLGTLLNLEGLTQGNALGSLDLNQNNLLALEGLKQLNTIESSELIQKALLGLESLTQTSILEGLTLSSAILLAVESLQNAATLQGVELLSGFLLSVNSLTQQSSIEEITLTQKNILEVASMLESNQLQEVSIYIPVEGNLITISAKSSGFGFSTKTNSFGFIGKGDN